MRTIQATPTTTIGHKTKSVIAIEIEITKNMIEIGKMETIEIEAENMIAPTVVGAVMKEIEVEVKIEEELATERRQDVFTKELAENLQVWIKILKAI